MPQRYGARSMSADLCKLQQIGVPDPEKFLIFIDGLKKVREWGGLDNGEKFPGLIFGLGGEGIEVDMGEQKKPGIRQEGQTGGSGEVAVCKHDDVVVQFDPGTSARPFQPEGDFEDVPFSVVWKMNGFHRIGSAVGRGSSTMGTWTKPFGCGLLVKTLSIA